MSRGRPVLEVRDTVIRAGLRAAAFGVLLLAINGIDRVHAGTLRSPLPNPYCEIPTFVMPVLRGEARALIEDGGHPVILMDAVAAERRNYARFLLSHECCHHKRGHLARLFGQERNQTFGWQARDLRGEAGAPRTVFSLRRGFMSRRRIELDADCCAARQLAFLGDRDALESAIRTMKLFGFAPTGPGYPSGIHRAAAIKMCAGLE